MAVNDDRVVCRLQHHNQDTCTPVLGARLLHAAMAVSHKTAAHHQEYPDINCCATDIRLAL